MQNKADKYWSKEEVLGKLKVNITKAFKDIYKKMNKLKVPMRSASYTHTLEMIVRKMK